MGGFGDQQTGRGSPEPKELLGEGLGAPVTWSVSRQTCSPSRWAPTSGPLHLWHPLPAGPFPRAPPSIFSPSICLPQAHLGSGQPNFFTCPRKQTSYSQNHFFVLFTIRAFSLTREDQGKDRYRVDWTLEFSRQYHQSKDAQAFRDAKGQQVGPGVGSCLCPQHLW